MGAAAGKPGGASAWHWDLPVRPATLQLATSLFESLEGVSDVLLEQATREPSTSAMTMVVRVMPLMTESGRTCRKN
jgi:hypothetical protein